MGTRAATQLFRVDIFLASIARCSEVALNAFFRCFASAIEPLRTACCLRAISAQRLMCCSNFIGVCSRDDLDSLMFLAVLRVAPAPTIFRFDLP